MTGLKRTPFKGRLNSLWGLFYCLLYLGVQIYVWHGTFSGYGEFNSKDKWHAEDIECAFTARLVMNVIAIVLSPMFILTCCVKIGNYANDGVKLGRDHTTENGMLNVQMCSRTSVLKILWKHSPPVAALIHVITAFLVVFSKMFTDAAEIKYGLKPAEFSWHSNVDFLFGYERAGGSFFRAAYRYNTLENATYLVVPTSSSSVPSSGAVSLEFLNYAVALITLTIRYAATFWFTSKLFTIMFVGIMLFMDFNLLTGFSVLDMLYKVTVNADINQNIDVKLKVETLLSLNVISTLLMLASTWLIFQHIANLFVLKTELFAKMQNVRRLIQDDRLLSNSFAGYSVHIISMLVLVALATLQAPAMWYYVTIYRTTNDSLILTAIAVSILYLVAWCLMWIVFTIKRDWSFRVLGFLPTDKPIAQIENEDVRKEVPRKIISNDNNEEIENKISAARLENEMSDESASLNPTDKTDLQPSLNDHELLNNSINDVKISAEMPICNSSPSTADKPTRLAHSECPSNDVTTFQCNKAGFDTSDRTMSPKSGFNSLYSNLLSTERNNENSLSRDSGIHETCSTPLRERHNSDEFVIASIVKLDSVNDHHNTQPVTVLSLTDGYEHNPAINTGNACLHPKHRLCSEV